MSVEPTISPSLRPNTLYEGDWKPNISVCECVWRYPSSYTQLPAFGIEAFEIDARKKPCSFVFGPEGGEGGSLMALFSYVIN